MEPDDADPRPLLPESSELELLELLLPELLEPESSELVELTVVPLLPESACRADTTATDNPVPPIPSTAVAIAAAEARRSRRRRKEWDASNASVVTMLQASREAPQPHSKRTSSDDQVLLKAL
ncbi:hypothetical protein [Kribbella sp. NPDC050470]|uniref:hypothetical protein n=1 Tax=unclassified Kribbella TaxID=2644121 RepID=UPI0037910479